MALALDQEIKERVRMAINIVDLIGGYLELRRQGRGFVARCPFHDDRRPSLQINPERQMWRCFVCEIGGDVFNFVMRKEGVTFPEALRMLADRAGIVIPEKRGGKPEDRERKRNLYRAMEWAILEYRDCFVSGPEAEPARDYMQSRGLNEASLQRFQVGYAPDAWTWLIDRGTAAGYSVDTLESVGLLSRSERGSRYDRFRGRVLFPILDPQGRPIALGGRVLPGMQEDAAKYINCNETALYQKSHQLYGLAQARERLAKTRQAIVMEGYTDVMMAVQHGVENAVACCGTAIGEHHIQLLKRYCEQVVLVLDGDEAGQRRTNEVLELFLEHSLDLRILTLPQGLDPCDYLQQQGGEAFLHLVEGAVDALEHKIRRVCQGFDPLLDTHRATTAIEEILQTMARASRRTGASSDAAGLRQDQILVRLSRQFGMGTGTLRARLDEIRRQSVQRQRIPMASIDGAPSLTDESAPPAVEYRYSELTPAESEWFEILVLFPELAPSALERFPPEFFESTTARALHQLYETLELDAHALDFSSVLSATEDMSLQSVLVKLETLASMKAAKAILTGEERLNSLCERLAHQGDAAQRKSMIRNLGQKQLDAQAELELLQNVLNQAKIRHGILPADE
jgi:DNA primase